MSFEPAARLSDIREWTDEAYESLKQEVRDVLNTLSDTDFQQKADYGSMSADMKTAYLMPHGVHEEDAELRAKLDEDGLSPDEKASIEEQLQTPFVKLGVCMYEKFGPQYALDGPKAAFEVASKPENTTDNTLTSDNTLTTPMPGTKTS